MAAAAQWTPVDETAAKWTPVADSTPPPDNRSLLDRIANDPVDIPLDSYWHATERGLANIGKGGAQAVQGTLSLLDPRAHDEHEKAVAVVNPVALPVYRMFRALGNTAEDAVLLAHEYHQDGGPSLQDIGDVAGTSAGNLIVGEEMGQAARAVPGAARAVGNVSKTKATAPLRAVIRGTNKVLQKAPSAVGASVGAGAGAAVGGHWGALIGEEIGRNAGRELLPKVNLPENVGLPKTVQGGPASAPSVEEFNPQAQPAPAAASPETAATAERATPQAPPPEPAPAPKVTQKAVKQQLEQSLGAPPPAPKPIAGVTMRNQSAAAQVAAGKLPEGYTPVDSSLLRGYKYDPGTQRFAAILKNGESYTHGEVTPEQVTAFKSADSQGSAWTKKIKQGPGTVLVEHNGRPNTPGTMSDAAGNIIAKKTAGRSVVVDPETRKPEFSDVVAAKKATKPAEKAPTSTNATSADTGSPDEDLTALLNESLKQVQRTKSGVEHVSADPARLVEEWGVNEDSLKNTREQTRGMSPEETEAFTQKLAERYKKGFPVEPLLETRDQYGNLLEVDGRQRAIAAHRAGIKEVPVMRRYLKK